MNTLEIIVLTTLALLVPAIIWIVISEVSYVRELKKKITRNQW